ncbi:hypothetical protein B0H11DRAFT_2282201 [Mycena galericulata]|nr:hypothetical protein B0H11DRAFT_2282201 [Mycena galericulata]
MSTAPSQDLLDYLTHERRWRDLAARKVDEKLPSQLFEGRGSLNHDFTDLATDQEAAGSRLFQRIEVWSVKLSGSGAVLERYPAVVSVLAKRNSDMLDAEEEEEAAPVKKKPRASKSSSAPPSDSFGEEDAASLDGLLGPDRVSVDKDSVSDSGPSPRPSSVDDEEDHMEDDELPSSGPNSDDHPTSVRLASLGRHAVRVGIATSEGFPLDHEEFAWTSVSDAVTSSNAPELVERLDMAKQSVERRSHLVKYAWGGAPQLRGEVKTLCKGAVALYGIPGNYTPAQIIHHIEWLTGKKGIFKFGGIDLKNHTYDVQQPYGAPFYKDVMTKQWFDSAKSEEVQAGSSENFIDSPIPTVTLVTGAMENALKEWATGVRITIKFTEEEFAPRYQHHQAALLNLQAKSPTWFAQFQRDLYSKIVSTSNFPHLKQAVAGLDEDELDGVDFEALEASATGANTTVTPVV